MAKVELPTHILEALRKVAVKEGIENAEFEPEGTFDNGFVALIKRWRIVGKNRFLPVVVKVLPDDDERNKKFFFYELFEREVLIYKELLPEFEKIQAEFGLKYRDEKGFWAYPKCYHAEYNEIDPLKSFIVMEDLATQNFIIKSLHEKMDLQHTEKVFIEIAKFHAMSFVMKAKKPETFKKFTRLNEMMCPLMKSEGMKHYGPRHIQVAADAFTAPEESHIRDKILSYKHDLWDKIEVTMDGDKPEPFAVVCHGDCWINNTLYSYEDSGKEKIESTILIDWQQTRYGSGPSELVYWLMCSCSKEGRANYQADLFKTYYETLGETLEVFGMDVKEVFPYASFVEQLRVFGLVAFGMASFGMVIDCKYPVKLFENKDEALTKEEEQCVAHYNEIIRDIVHDLIAMEII